MKAYEKTIKLRKKRKIKKSQLCNSLHFNLEDYKLFEKGELVFEEYQLKKIADYFHVPVDYILDDNSYLTRIQQRHIKRHLSFTIPLFVFIIVLLIANLIYSIMQNISIIDIILVHGILILTTIVLFFTLLYSIKNDDFTLIQKMIKVTRCDLNKGKTALFSILNLMLCDSLFCSLLFVVNYTSLLKRNILIYYNLSIIIIFLFLLIFSYKYVNRKYIKKYKKGLLI